MWQLLGARWFCCTAVSEAALLVLWHVATPLFKLQVAVKLSAAARRPVYDAQVVANSNNEAALHLLSSMAGKTHTQNQKPETENYKPKTQDPNPENRKTRSPKPDKLETRNRSNRTN